LTINFKDYLYLIL